ncbi:MAG: homoserine kinase [Dehalococcoidia bacterium]|nr:homoserine kinase [Dehalococcoidia bacterium]
MAASSVTLRLPATTANLGPGFDCLGAALDLTADVTVSLAQPAVPHGPAEKAVVVAAEAACRYAGKACPPLSVDFIKTIPHARGLGHSAVCRAAGMLAAEALCDAYLQDHEMLALGTELEGHADNIAACLFGGLQVVARSGMKVYRAGLPAPSDLSAVLFIPDFEMSTDAGRGLLPRELSREDAVFNMSRTALLVAALVEGMTDLLWEATQDRLHQPARTQIFPQMPAIFAAAREAGALCAFLSGGGSTIVALARNSEDEIGSAMTKAAEANGVSGQTVVTHLSNNGASALDQTMTPA